MSTIRYSPVSLQDSDADRDELEIIRNWMMRDEPAPDECPTLDEPFTPDLADESWWSETSNGGFIEGHKLLAHRHVNASLAVALTECEHPEGDSPRYSVRSYGGGFQTAVQGFDSKGDAECWFRHVTTPVRLDGGPRDGEWVIPAEGGAEW